MRTDLLKGHLDSCSSRAFGGSAHGYLISRRLRERSRGEFDFLKARFTRRSIASRRRVRFEQVVVGVRPTSARLPADTERQRGARQRENEWRQFTSTVELVLGGGHERELADHRISRAARPGAPDEARSTPAPAGGSGGSSAQFCGGARRNGSPEEAAQIAVERFGAAAVVARRFAQAVASARRGGRSRGQALLSILYGRQQSCSLRPRRRSSPTSRKGRRQRSPVRSPPPYSRSQRFGPCDGGASRCCRRTGCA